MHNLKRPIAFGAAGSYLCFMLLSGHSRSVYLVWAVLGIALVVSLIERRYSVSFVAVATFGLTLLPILFFRRFRINVPVGFLTAIMLFVFATIFLGEAFDFYGRYWWWDVFLHGGSALGFGLIGFIFVFMLFEGDRYAAPPLAIAFVAYCFGVTIGTTWEIFEFAMDQIFGLNMQKSGLQDTMWDLIVDSVGASIGGWAGYFYLRGRELGGLSDLIDDFINKNRRLFRKFRSK